MWLIRVPSFNEDLESTFIGTSFFSVHCTRALVQVNYKIRLITGHKPRTWNGLEPRAALYSVLDTLEYFHRFFQWNVIRSCWYEYGSDCRKPLVHITKVDTAVIKRMKFWIISSLPNLQSGCPVYSTLDGLQIIRKVFKSQLLIASRQILCRYFILSRALCIYNRKL